MRSRGYMLLLAGLVFGGALFSQAQKEGDSQTQGEKKPVDVTAEVAYRTPDLEENAIIMVGQVAFHHNGAVIACDSAVRYSDRRIECFKNVIINKDSIFVYGDRAEYNGDLDLARVYSPVIKVVDGDATLYTYNFTFNTRDNIGRWFGGGVMYQQDNVMESESGYFYSDLHELVAVRAVQMKNESHQIISDSVRYNTETKVASFYTRTYIWTEAGEMISALKGRYNTRDSTYFFHDNAYVLDEFRESWADTIDFNARVEDAVFYGNVQIDDREHDSSAFGDLGRYWGERGETMLTRRPALLNYNADRGNTDTLYMRADTVFMFVRYPSDGSRYRDSLGGGADETDRFAHLKRFDSLSDSVRLLMADSLAPVISGLRGRIADMRRRADSIMTALYPPAPEPQSVPAVDTLPPAAGLPRSVGLQQESVSEPENREPPEVIQLRARATELTVKADSLASAESYIRPRPKSVEQLANAADSLARLRVDSLARIDSLVRIDSIRTADPKAYRVLQKAAAKRLKAQKARLAAERREAKFAEQALLREEKARLRAERRAEKTAARNAAKAAKIAERRRSVQRSADTLDSLGMRDSLARFDTLPPLVDSLALRDSTAPRDTTAAAPDTTLRIFRGWYDVRIWRKDMQAVSDSVVGFSVDSTLHMYTRPVIWHGDSQITADSIVLYTAGEQIEKGEFYGNPIMGSKIGEGAVAQFNQVKGRRMTSWFKDGELRRHDAKGNAQALYYMQEEERGSDGRTVMSDAMAFLVMSATDMSFIFEADSLRYIVPREVVDYTVYPMEQIPGSQPTRLQGFTWQPERKPELSDVFDRRVRPSEREFYEAMPRPGFPIAARIDRRREYLIENRMWGDRTDPLPGYAIEFRRQKYVVND